MGTAAIIAISLSSLAGVLVVGGFAYTARSDRDATRRKRASRQHRATGNAGSEPEAPSPPVAGDDTGEVRDDP